MSDTIAISRMPTTAGCQLVEQLDRLLVALTETEDHAATILAFDPDTRRYTHASTIANDLFECRYPLREWGWDRAARIARMRSAPCRPGASG